MCIKNKRCFCFSIGLVIAKLCSFYAPNFEEVDGAYWFRVVRPCVRACVRSSRTVHARVLKFHIGIPHGKIFDAHFFLVRVISLSGVMPLWIKSEWNLMHAISYEPCKLGFWNFMYGFLMEKKLTSICFLVRVTSLSGVMPLWKNQNEMLSVRYLEKCLS